MLKVFNRQKISPTTPIRSRSSARIAMDANRADAPSMAGRSSARVRAAEACGRSRIATTRAIASSYASTAAPGSIS